MKIIVCRKSKEQISEVIITSKQFMDVSSNKSGRQDTAGPKQRYNDQLKVKFIYLSS
jgi:hypothetical protein